ncbi:RGS domain-containing protein [Lipomyces kononenkoae]|uniref:RGS domain-containing protein n=1 Tax=Lipomyces kononenkoae TaxID=34357 RepID=A0ACC3T7G7_LIPKO
MPRFRSSSRAGFLLLGLSGRDQKRDRDNKEATDASLVHGRIPADPEPVFSEQGQHSNNPAGSKRSYHAAEISSSSSSSVGSAVSSPSNSEPVSPLITPAAPDMPYFAYTNAPTSAPSTNPGWMASASAVPGADRTSKRMPTLDEVLSNEAVSPFSLTEFIAYLALNHCLETIEFTMDVKRYAEVYESAVASLPPDVTKLGPEHRSYDHVMLLWHRITDSYIRLESPRELNIPANIRNDLLMLARVNVPPGPDKFEDAISAVKDLMNESVFIRFLNDAQLSVVAEEPEAGGEMLSPSTSTMRGFPLSHQRRLSNRQMLAPFRSISSDIPRDQLRPEYFRTSGSGSSEDDSGYTYSGGASPMTPPESPEVFLEEEFTEIEGAPATRSRSMSNNIITNAPKQLLRWRRMSKRFKWRSGSSSGDQ